MNRWYCRPIEEFITFTDNQKGELVCADIVLSLTQYMLTKINVVNNGLLSPKYTQVANGKSYKLNTN